METSDRYFTELATAFVRGRLGKPTATIDDGRHAGLRLHKFKNDTQLPRVRQVIGILRGLSPEDILDVGSGRGREIPDVTEAPLVEWWENDDGLVRR